MKTKLAQELHARIGKLRSRWETLLRIEPVNSPLAHPDAMVHLIPESLGEVLHDAARQAAPVSLAEARAPLPACQCGHNPYLSFFTAGEQALVEAAVLVQAEMPENERRQSDVAAVIQAVRQKARCEIDTFCTVCTHREKAAKCRHAAAV